MAAERGLTFDSYEDLWCWSTTDLEGFWQSIWDYFALQSPTPHSAVLASRGMPCDRVAAYLPNAPETVVAFLATVSIEGVWSLCAPDMGTNAVLDRRVVVVELCAALPSVKHLVLQANLGLDLDALETAVGRALFTVATSRNDASTLGFEPLWLPFDHPLWIVYSSGTTGLPKPIVHS